MRKEEYMNIIENFKKSLDKKLENQILKYAYNKLGNHDVIEVYLKAGTDVMDMAKILSDLEDTAEKLGYIVLVDFLKG
ncbi:MAG: hypothetical protein ACRC41_16580 [Sarcina sp.]